MMARNIAFRTDSRTVSCYLLRNRETRKKEVLTKMIRRPAGIPVNMKPIIPRIHEELPNIIPRYEYSDWFLLRL